MVFRTVKRIMETERECPNAARVASIVGITPQRASEHMRALVNARGLPMPIVTGQGKRKQSRSNEPIAEFMTDHFPVDAAMANGYTEREMRMGGEYDD